MPPGTRRARATCGSPPPATATPCASRCRIRGAGIAPEDAERLFEPFVRGSDSRGSGIGLAICRSIVEAHGGTISVRRTFGGGATFSFTVPVHASERT